MYDIIIVGAGPAGLTAALYALRANKKVLILEAKSCGGKILNANLIENYPGLPSVSGSDFASKLYEQVTSKGADIKYEYVVKIDEDKKVYTNENVYSGKSVIIATGTTNRALGIPKEKDFVGSGVSYCATCDGNFFKDKVVAVIGSGETAIEDAIYLSEISSKVYLIYKDEALKSKDKYKDKLDRIDNIEYIKNTKVKEILGDNLVTGLSLIDKNNSETTIDVDGIFIAVGQEPNNEMFKNVIDTDKYGYIISEDGVHTKTPGIYVAGDARVKDLRQLTTAVADGSIAATTAIKEMK